MSGSHFSLPNALTTIHNDSMTRLLGDFVILMRHSGHACYHENPSVKKGDCNLIPRWHSIGHGHQPQMTPHPLHQ